MDDHPTGDQDSALIDRYRITIRSLTARYGWALLTEDQLLGQLLGELEPGEPPADLERRIKNQYIVALYAACHPEADPQQQTQGYTDLARFLARPAYHRWPDLAEDVIQQALMLVHAHFQRCRAPITFQAFALNCLRWAAQQVAGRPAPAQPLPEEQPATAAEPSDPGADLLAAERSRAVQEAVAALPERQRQTVVLKYFQHWSDEAIAEHLGSSPGNVRVIRHRALQQLRLHPGLRAYLDEPA